MPLEPPPFQEAPRCDVCKCSFNTFRRRMRDCKLISAKADPHPSLGGVDYVTDEVSRLNIDAVMASKTEATAEHQSVTSIPDCKCGMPLCICESPAPITDSFPILAVLATPNILFQVSYGPIFVPEADERPSILSGFVKSKSKRTDTVPKSRGSSSNSRSSLVFNPGLVTNGNAADKSQMDYDVNGEGLREAIKNGDTAAVKKLPSEVCLDANYHDKQGLSLLHLVLPSLSLSLSLSDVCSSAHDYNHVYVSLKADQLNA
ncbi:hypothetical protein CRYUN_Cryun02cG0032600 [Craigia yunnanensis]